MHITKNKNHVGLLKNMPCVECKSWASEHLAHGRLLGVTHRMGSWMAMTVPRSEIPSESLWFTLLNFTSGKRFISLLGNPGNLFLTLYCLSLCWADGVLVEDGAEWIHGGKRNPLYRLARNMRALSPKLPEDAWGKASPSPLSLLLSPFCLCYLFPSLFMFFLLFPWLFPLFHIFIIYLDVSLPYSTTLFSKMYPELPSSYLLSILLPYLSFGISFFLFTGPLRCSHVTLAPQHHRQGPSYGLWIFSLLPSLMFCFSYSSSFLCLLYITLIVLVTSD